MSRPASIRNQDLRQSRHKSPAGNNSHSHHRSNNSNSNNNSSYEHQYSGQSHNHGHAKSAQRQHLEPRQPRHQLPTSDYETDTANELPSQELPTEKMAERTNTELNLLVLKRYRPSITGILSIAANAVIYALVQQEWKKTTTEGAMFVCSQGKGSNERDPGCIMVLNRKSLRNLIVDLGDVNEFEQSGDLFIFNLRSPGEEMQLETGETVVAETLGVWTYAEEPTDRATNANLIYDLWSQVRESRTQTETSDPSPSSAPSGSSVVMGQRVSMADLFASFKNGNTASSQAPRS